MLRYMLLALIFCFTATIFAQSPRELREGAVTALQGIVTNDPKLQKSIDKAIDFVQRSLEFKGVPQFLDDFRLVPKTGKKSFANSGKAIKTLAKEIAKDGTPQDIKDAFQQVVDDLLLADNEIAALAVQDVEDLVGIFDINAKKLGQATGAFAQAVAEPDPAKASKFFSKAWDSALKAVSNKIKNMFVSEFIDTPDPFAPPLATNTLTATLQIAKTRADQFLDFTQVIRDSSENTVRTVTQRQAVPVGKPVQLIVESIWDGRDEQGALVDVDVYSFVAIAELVQVKNGKEKLNEVAFPISGTIEIINQEPVISAIDPNEGPNTGGTFVTITGENFINVQQVQIGLNDLLDVDVIDENTITGTTPADVLTRAVARDVVVVTDQGTAILQNGFTYFTAGELVVAKSAVGNGGEEGTSVATFADGSFVAVGFFDKDMTFGPGEANETILSSVGGDDIFVAKFNADGSLAFAKRAGGPNGDNAFSVAPFADGSFVVTGCFINDVTFGLGEANETTLVSAGGQDVFVAKYDANGNLVFAKRAGGTSLDEGHGITSLSDGSFITIGTFQSNAVFGPGEANETTLLSNGSRDIFVAKFAANGDLVFAKRAGGSNADEGLAIALLSDDGFVTTGTFRSNAVFGPGEANETTLNSAGGSRDIFIARYDVNGALVFAKRAGGNDGEEGLSIAAFADDSFVITGFFTGSATFGAGEANETTLVSAAGSPDFCIAKFTANGDLIFAKRGGSNNTDEGRGITIFSDGSFAVTGLYRNNAVFGPGEANETTLASAGVQDIFTARFNVDGTLDFVKNAGGNNGDEGRGIAAFADASFVITGVFRNTVVFGAGEANETTLVADSGREFFVVKFERNE